MQQRIITAKNNYEAMDQWLAEHNTKSVFLVCDNSIRYLQHFTDHLKLLEQSGMRVVTFDDFQTNPTYESVVRGVLLLRRTYCDCMIAVGGGSAIDVAKCIKLFYQMDGDGEDGSYLHQEANPGQIPFLVMPTTAGTGSEATRFAVIYYRGEKQSITSDSFIPKTVLMDPSTLKTLPLYQKKATMMDALCHAIESYWSINSTDESKRYSREGIRGVLDHLEGYLNNSDAGNAGMMYAAHAAGKAINITQTTAGHAMCYKISSLFHIAHGHAAALCDRVLFRWMVDNYKRCTDPRGAVYLKTTLDEIGRAMGCKDGFSGAEKLQDVFSSLQLDIPSATAEQMQTLQTGVNPERLKNHPIALDAETIRQLYQEILKA